MAMNQIKRYRIKHKLTLEGLAARFQASNESELATVTKSTIWKYENGIVPPAAVALAISRATDFEIPMAALWPEIAEAVRAEIARETEGLVL